MTAPDEISDWAISAALLLIERRLHGTPFTGILVAGTRSEADSYQTLVCVAREIGRMLRPDGHRSAEPIGANEAVLQPVTRDLLALGATHAAVVRDVATAARLIGSAAAADAPMVRALGLAVAAAGDAPTSARSVLRAMLEILAHEPIVRADPPGEP